MNHLAVAPTTGIRWVDWAIALSFAITAFTVLWARIVGPFIFKPLGKVFQREMDEVIAKRLEPLEHALDLASQALATIDSLVRRHHVQATSRFDSLENRVVRLENHEDNEGVRGTSEST